LVGQCNPGDDVQVVGIVFQRWHSLGKGPGGTTDIELAIEANHLEVLNIQQRCQRLTIEEKSTSLIFGMNTKVQNWKEEIIFCDPFVHKFMVYIKLN